jgi:DNA polymerase-3 subunit gamma/tau
VFENVLGQVVSGQLIGDIEAKVIAPAMLFSGPPASGKGTAALEFGRIISCETRHAETESGRVMASWNCGCSACLRHRLLIHPDLLCLGWRPFSAEIAASAGAFRREPASPAKTLFIRSIRKLLARFNPVLWDDEPKAAKISPLVNSLEEDLDEVDFLTGSPSENGDSLAKLVDGMIKDAIKLESSCLSETIPIAQIRRAAFWGRLAPAGIGKLIVIESTDLMQEGAQNSLLKLLEEPPPRLSLVLTTSQPGRLPHTILSRLRPYRFSARGEDVENEVVRRVFRDEAKAGGISAYLDSFLPVSASTLDAMAAFFAASVAYKAALLSKRQGRPLPEEVVLLGKSNAPLAEAAGLGRPKGDAGVVVALILEKAESFEIRSLFPRFLFFLLEKVSKSQKNPFPVYNEMWKDCCNRAKTSVGVYNLRPVQALEKLFTDLSSGMAKL